MSAFASSGFSTDAFSILAFDFGQVAPEEVTNRTGDGWEHYVAPRKTLKQYKKEYLELSYFEIDQEKEKVASEIKLVEQDIRFNRDLGLKDVIARLKVIIVMEKVKLQALEWVEQERVRRWKNAKQKIVDEDLVFIATYLEDD